MLYNSVLVSAVHQHELAISIYVYVPSLLNLPPTLSHPSRLSQSTSLSFPHQTANSHWLSILHLVMYMLSYYSLNSSHPLLLLLCPQVFSLHLLLYSCSENRCNSTIFLDSILRTNKRHLFFSF